MVTTPGTMEYRMSLNGGTEESSGPLNFANTEMGIPDGTKIGLRSQSLSYRKFWDANFDGVLDGTPDSSKITFSNFDFNGDAPGAAAGFGAGGVPEPATWLSAMVGVLFVTVVRRRGRADRGTSIARQIQKYRINGALRWYSRWLNRRNCP